MNDASTFERIAAAADRSRRVPSPGDQQIVKQCRLQPLTGGCNNAAFAFELHGVRYCLKLYITDERQRAEREWAALTLLAEQNNTIAPQTRWRAMANGSAAIIMEWVPGVDLRTHTPGRVELAALAVTLQQVYAITPTTAHFPFVVVGTPASLIKRTAAWAERVSPSTDPLLVAARALIGRWLAGDDGDYLREGVPAVFGRGDPSLANCLWDGTRVRCIDWEYAGWSDLALELADLLEGPWSNTITNAAWQGFLAHFDLHNLYPRFMAARRLLRCFWLGKYGEQYANGTAGPAQLRQQIEYVTQVNNCN